jgi:Protein of unknown function (DUF1236)
MIGFAQGIPAKDCPLRGKRLPLCELPVRVARGPPTLFAVHLQKHWNLHRLEPFPMLDRAYRHQNRSNQMRKTFMVSVAAAALLAATGLATAQGVNQGGMKGSESPAAASPKGDSAAPTNAPAAKGTEATTPGTPKAGMPQQAQDKGGSSGVNAQSKPDPKTTGDMKADSKAKASDSTTTTTNSKDMKNPTAETKSPADSKATGEMKADSKSKASDSKSPASEGKTTGNAATSATAAPPAEKQSQIASAIKQEKVEEVTNVNFNISIGTAVPSSVRYYPLPPRIVEIYPEWRGYDFILVRGKYIILRPQTREIVYIIEG